MAARLSGNRIAWTYTDANGVDWRVAACKYLTDQGVLGGSAADPTLDARPNWGKMRRISVSGTTGHSRTLPVYDTSATILTTGTMVNVNYGDASEAMTKSGPFLQETTQGGRTTKQST